MNILKNVQQRLIACLFVLTLIISNSVAAQTDATDDIRMIIDVSGSMKKNDPDNLRAPALRLLTRLLPDNTQAGVWTFAQSVNNLVLRGPVDDQWRESAAKASNEIHSYGLFTNIEAALQDASWDLKKPDPKHNRHIILLTDGIVDIPGDQDEQSRQRILQKLLPRLKKAGVALHTIALSDDADHSLLRQLSLSTNGSYKKVSEAAVLERIFLNFFEEATRPNTLPIIDKKIKVDDSIAELTILVFHKKTGQPLQITSPSNDTIDAEHLPKNTRWQHEENYNLITIKQPTSGYWTIDAAEDPDNRILVITALKLLASRIPSVVDSQTPPQVNIRLIEKNEHVRDNNFLNIIEVTSRLTDPKGRVTHHTLKDNGIMPDLKKQDGIFNVTLPDSLSAGEYTHKVMVNGITFQREIEQTFTVYTHPAEATISPAPHDDDHYELSVITFPQMVKTDSTDVTASLTTPSGTTSAIDITRINPMEWHSAFAADETGQHSVDVIINGEKLDGTAFSKPLETLYFSHIPPGSELPPTLPEVSSTLSSDTADDHEPVEETSPDDEDEYEEYEDDEYEYEEDNEYEDDEYEDEESEEDTPKKSKKHKVNLITVLWQTVLGNVILFGLLFVAYRLWKKKFGHKPTVSDDDKDAEAT